MYVHSVRLTNYRSIGNYREDEILVEPAVTAIIGKNESGKSNILEGMSLIDLRKPNPKAFESHRQNRGEGEHHIRYTLVLKAYPHEKAMGIVGDTEIVISRDGCSTSGGLKTYFDIELASKFVALAEILGRVGSGPFRNGQQEQNDYRTFVNVLKDTATLDLHQRYRALDFFAKRSKSIPVEQRDAFNTQIDIVKKAWDALCRMLPVFYLRKTDRVLEAKYKYEDIEKELASPQAYPNSLLASLLKVIKISNTDFLFAVKSGNQERQSTLRERIRDRIEEYINEPFRMFYATERIRLKADFIASEVCFMVKSADGDTFQLSERSNGLRWYLNTFIDIQANNLPDTNVVYLLDEPGLSLHVNAQRELLQLFENLCSQGNQIIYTTHSPTMLNTDHVGLHRIRAVVKDDEGYSRIYKSAFDTGLMQKDRTDTLAPIVAAIGMNLSCVFGPGQNRINVVPEGMSDYIYLMTMAKLLDFDMERYTIIPTKGASNAINICAILKGWGCPFIAVFDYDDAGVKSGGEDMEKNFGFTRNVEYCYLYDATPEELEQKTYIKNRIEIEDVVGRAEIERFLQARGQSDELSKTLKAKLMCNASDVGEFVFSNETLERFRKLFARIEAYTANVQ